MKYIAVYIILLFTANSRLDAQDSIRYFQFKMKNNIPDLKIRAGMELEFKVKRRHISKNELCEAGIFSSDTTEFYCFKVFGNIWYLKTNEKWLLFFSPKLGIQNQYIYIQSNKYRIYAKGRKRINGLQSYIFNLKPIGFEISERSDYYFHPKFGIIALQSPSVFLIRDSL
jgi:hypothetical protein